MTESDSTPTLCSYLDWDSNFFGLRIARLEPHRLDEAVVAQAAAWARENRIECLYFLADANDPHTARIAQANDYLPVDVRLTFERPVPKDPAQATPGVRVAREQDLPALRAIAGKSHSDTRFYFDSHFDRARCDQLYETWIENSMHGFAQGVLAAEQHGRAVGYVTLHLRDEEAQIGLIAIAAGFQGSGLGKQLVYAALDWAREHDARTMKVVTQGRNVPAQRLYQRCGFVTAGFEIWYHKWFSSSR